MASRCKSDGFFQIPIFQADDWNNIGRHLAFRDYMRTHEKERDEYAKLKKDLAQKFPYDIDGYCDGKEDFVREMEERALAQYDGTWDKLYIAARKVQNERKLSPMMEAGSVSAALLSSKGNIYTGVCIDAACSLGMCAERNAIASMITNGESRIIKIVAVMPDGKAGMPCGVCREFMMQLNKAAGETEILCDYETKKAVRLKSFAPLSLVGSAPGTVGGDAPAAMHLRFDQVQAGAAGEAFLMIRADCGRGSGKFESAP